MPQKQSSATDSEKKRLLSEIAELEQELASEDAIMDEAFEWIFEFPEMLDENFNWRGFDVVLGNPPYISGRDFGTRKQNLKKYYNQHYKVAEYQLNLYQLFIELAACISAQKANLSYIVPNTWLANHRTQKIRAFFLKNLSLNEIAYSHEKIFAGANVDVVVFIAQKVPKNTQVSIKEICAKKFRLNRNIQFYDFLKNEKQLFDIYTTAEASTFIKKMESDSKPLHEYVAINRGIHAYRTDGFGKSKFSGGFQTKMDYEKRSYHSNYKLNKTYRPALKGKHVFCYYSVDSGEYISYGNWLAEAREPQFFEGDRIYLRKILGKKGFVANLFTKENEAVADQSLYIAKPKTDDLCMEYVLAFLNSSLVGYYFRLKYNEFDKLFPQIKVTEFKNLPIKFPSTEVQVQIKMYVNQLIVLKKQNKDLNISEIELKIEKIFYQLYNLNDVEIQTIKQFNH